MSTLLELVEKRQMHTIAHYKRTPIRWKAGGTRKGTKAGPRFSLPHTTRRAVVKKARTFRDRWNAAARSQRRQLNSLTKALFSNAANHKGVEAGECECPPRVVDSLTLEDYLCLQEDLQALSVQEGNYGMLRYATDQQLLLNICCSPTPQHASKGVDNSPI